MKRNTKVSVYDTTLRDGNQAVGLGFSLSDKLRIAQRLSDIGIDYIEGGWPNRTNTIDQEFYREIRKYSLKSRVAAFGSTRRPRVSCGKDQFLQMLVATEAPVITIFGKTWDMHVTEVIGTTLEENLAMIGESIDYLRRYTDEVIYDAEHFFDGYKKNPDYALKTIMVAQEAGAHSIVLCDTNGGMLPGEFLQIYRRVRETTTTPPGVHMHNDAGCADANTFLAVDEGAVHIQGTIGGLGERCGNANLCTLIPGLQLKKGIRIVSDARLRRLTETSIFVSEIANLSHNIRLPYVGESAFSHKAGAHADGVRKNRISFEHVNPALVGNTRRFVVSSQAGASTLLQRLEDIRPGLEKKNPDVQRLLMTVKRLEAEGYHFEAADGSFELLARETLGMFKKPFDVKGFRVIEEQRDNGYLISEATIKVEEENQFEHTAAEGDGPVNALDNALRKALVKFYPSLKEVKLDDFKVRVLDGKEGTAAKVRVLIESNDGKNRWSTIGVSTNIIEASWIALIDSIKYKLMKDRK
jgi:2-isopropylmalate synthase